MPRLVVEDHSTLRLLRAGLIIELDGREVGHLPFGAREDFQIASGRHTLLARAGSALSAPVAFSVFDRETIGFTSQAAGTLRTTISLSQSFLRGSSERFGARRRRHAELPAERSLDPESWPHILGVPETAPMAEIRRAYLKLIWRCHPDHAGFEHEARRSAEESARRLNIAYDSAKKAHAQADRVRSNAA